MKRKKVLIGTVLVGLPLLAVGMLYAFFFAVFYFPNRAGAISGSLVSSGETRQYLLYVPKSYDPKRPTPLVISLHTSMSWPTSAMNISQWNSVAEEQGIIVVYPAGSGAISRSWEMSGSENPARMPDVIFISHLLDALESTYNIDKTQIFANGMSNGGGMAFVLSCTLSDRIAAVGMVSAGLYPPWSWCTDHRPVPVIAFHGSADPIAPYDGNGTFQSVPTFMANWARRNQCQPKPVESAFAAKVTRFLYTNCADDAAVLLYRIQDEGHQWPGGKPIVATWMVGHYSGAIDATRQMWAFFHAHPLTHRLQEH